MKPPAVLLAGLLSTLPCAAQRFVSTELSKGGKDLVLTRSDGSRWPAPRLEYEHFVSKQDSFEQPSVSPRGRYVGWLALYPGVEASYSQPLHLVVMDGDNRLHRFAGDWGMVFGWCFDPSGEAVTFRYSFPHGITDAGFDTRRISDGKLLRTFTLPAALLDVREEDLRWRVPRWARCALTRNNEEEDE